MAQFNSIDELEKNKSRWTLESDQKLLNTLQSTSERTLSNIQRIFNNFQSTVDEVNKQTNKVDNLLTSVLLLSNSKFVENRVYDEDIDEIQKNNAPAFQPKKNDADSKFEAEQQFMHNLRTSIIDGSKKLQAKFGLDHDDIEHLDKMNLINNLYRQNDSFSKIPLPFLIGSEDFVKTTFVGLKNSPINSPIRLTENSSAFNYNEQTIANNSNRTPSFNDQDDVYQPNPYNSTQNHQPTIKSGNDLFSPIADDYDEDDDLFSNSIISQKEISSPKTNTSEISEVDREPALPDVMSQLTAQIKNKLKQTKSLSSISSSSSLSTDNASAQQQQQKPTQTVKSSIVIPKTVQKSIFDSDEDSDNDLFSKPIKKIVDNKSDSSLRSDSVFSYNSSTPATNSNVDSRSKSSISSNSGISVDVNATKNRMKSIFNSDDNLNEQAKQDKNFVENKKQKNNLFGSYDDLDEEDDLFGNKISKQTKIQTVYDSGNSLKSTNQRSVKNISIPKPIKQKSIFDSDDDDDLFGNKAQQPKNVGVSTKTVDDSLAIPSKTIQNSLKNTYNAPTSKSKSLFDSDEDDDLFVNNSSKSKTTEKAVENSFKTSQQPVQNASTSKITASKSLFYSDEKSFEGNTSKTETKEIKNQTETKVDEKQKTFAENDKNIIKTATFAPNVISELNSKFTSNSVIKNSVDNEKISRQAVSNSSSKSSFDNFQRNKTSNIFDDEDDDDLFGGKNRNIFKQVNKTEQKEDKIEEENFVDPLLKHEKPEIVSRKNQESVILPNNEIVSNQNSEKDHLKVVEESGKSIEDDKQNGDNNNVSSTDHVTSIFEDNKQDIEDKENLPKSMISKGFLSDLNNKLAKKNFNLPEKDKNFQVNNPNDDSAPQNDEKIDNSSEIFDDLSCDDHLKILRSKNNANFGRKRKPPSRGLFEKIVSETNENFVDSYEKDSSDTIKPQKETFSKNDGEEEKEVEQKQIITADKGDKIDDKMSNNPLNKQGFSTPIVLEVDIQVTVPKETQQNLMVSENVKKEVQRNFIVSENVPKEVQQNSIVSENVPKKSQQIKKSLFDSDDSDSDLFGGSNKSTLKTSNHSKNHETKSINTRSNISNKNATSLSSSTSSTLNTKPKINPNLFGSDSDDEEKILSTTVIQAHRRLQAKKSIFQDDSDDDLFKS